LIGISPQPSVGGFSGRRDATTEAANGLEWAPTEHRERYEKLVNLGISSDVAVARMRLPEIMVNNASMIRGFCHEF
jgi:hypothetical protein